MKWPSKITLGFLSPIHVQKGSNELLIATKLIGNVLRQASLLIPIASLGDGSPRPLRFGNLQEGLQNSPRARKLLSSQ